MKKIKLSFKIPRRLWFRGDNFNGENALSRPGGRRCCLGHFALACGVGKDALRGHECLETVKGDGGTETLPKSKRDLFDSVLVSESQFMAANDEYLKGGDRERELVLQKEASR